MDNNNEIFYFPLLDHGDALIEVKTMCEKPLRNLRGRYSHTKSYFNPLSTKNVQTTQLEEIREGVLEIAYQFGFPRPLTRSERSNFDNYIGNYLLGAMPIHPTEAADPEMWNFFTLVILPDVAKWRWPNDSDLKYPRWLGTHRNAFRKTWWRAKTLGPELNLRLQEDEGVGIMERPTFGGNPELAQLIAKVHLDNLENYKAHSLSRMQGLRRAMVHLSRWAVLIDFDSMPAELKEARIRQTFESSIELMLNSAHPHHTA